MGYRCEVVKGEEFMHISRIKLVNFRSFIGEHTIDFSTGINFFVGDNNCGKTTVFRAIEFLQGAKDKAEYITKGKEDEEVSVELEFRGDDLSDIINEPSLNLKKYQDYIIDNEDGTYSLKILRSSEATTILQRGKTTNLDIKNIRVYNPKSEEDGIKKYENPTGIDKTITALFDAQFVYSDLKNEDYQDFGKTKIIGKLINVITKDFQKEFDEKGNKTVWGAFKDAHAKAFGDDGLLSILKGLEKEITQILKEQYGESEVKFNFGLPEIDNFFKTGNIMLSDNGITTPVSQKGTGMQRALALSLIQIYAKISNKTESEIDKPLLFFVDEPETFLHPKAQNKLMEALNSLSKKSQIFITTHSPYLLKVFDKTQHQINVFYRDDGSSKAKNKSMLDLFGKYSPSWGEINYIAFDVVSVEFHNELYGFLQARAICESEKYYHEKDFDSWLKEKGLEQNILYKRLKQNGELVDEQKTLPTFIRNIIHHPENQHNTYIDTELRASIEQMLAIVKAYY